MGKLIDGKAIAEKILKRTAERVNLLQARGVRPHLGVLLVGDDKPSETYVRRKGEAAKRIGIAFTLEKLSARAGEDDVLAKLKEMQSESALTGLIVQLPLPKQIDTARVLQAIRPDIDVDCLTAENLGKLVMNTAAIVPPTPGAVMSILEDLRVKLEGANVTIVGTGALVGKPLAVMMMNAGASVTTCNSKTRDTKEKCLAAEIIVTGVGKKDILRGDAVSKGAIVIDTGVAFEGGKMFGDVNVQEVLTLAAHVTPTPGGVGPITVAQLLWNTVLCAERTIKDPSLRDPSLRSG